MSSMAWAQENWQNFLISNPDGASVAPSSWNTQKIKISSDQVIETKSEKLDSKFTGTYRKVVNLSETQII